MRGAALTRSHFNVRPVLAGIGGALIVMALPHCASPGRAETMSSALARAYAGNPGLNQQRAGVRATDENLPRASAAWRPTATATGQYGIIISTSPRQSRLVPRRSGPPWVPRLQAAVPG